MKAISTTFITILILLGFGSCKKYLDKKPDNKLAVPTTVEDFQAILDFQGYMNLGTTPFFGESSADDFFLLQTTIDNLSPENKKIYSWIPHVYNFDNDWSKAYLAIYNANLCLEGIEKAPVINGNEVKWRNVKGSALFYRSYYFLLLSWTFAKAYDETSSDTELGVVLRLTSDFNAPSFRSSVQQSYDQIIKDAKESLPFLPNNPVHVFRPSKAAAYALLSRAYLSMHKYDSAFRYADLCLQIKSDLMDYNSDGDIIDINSNVPFKQFNKETIFYTEMNSMGVHIPVRGRIDTLLYNSYASDDLRKTAFFRPNGSYRRFKGSYASSTSVLFSGIATDEMYITRAECFAKLGDVNRAMNDINTLLIKRWNNTVPYLPMTAIDAADAVNKIRQERRKELLMRGIRWSDIKRYNKEGVNLILTRQMNGQPYSLQPNANYYALPLPDDVVRTSGIQQN